MVRNDQAAGNMFMVGDVKQSIYRFRHAEPSLFLSKYKLFKDDDQQAKRIDLARNFRSREDVLIGTNYIFRQILNEALGEMEYDEAAELIYGNKTYDAMPYPNKALELLIVDRDGDKVEESDEEDVEGLEKSQIEAKAYAKKIKEWIGTTGSPPLQVGNKSTGVQRDIQYRDIVILKRSMTDAAVVEDVFKKEGIPVYAELSSGYFDAIEVKIMIALLKVIDNPRQDIPLASVLRSPIVGLTEEELAKIRLAKQKGTYYDALQTYNSINDDDTSQRLTRFMKKLNAFRMEARLGALSTLIWEIYRETGYYDFVGGMPGGRQRTANLRALYDRARSYEKTSFRGLFRFLRFIERMEERGDDLGSARALSEQEDVVRIMTIHKSKGLEFPVVILGGMDKQFNMQDFNKKYTLDKELGFGTKYIDPIKRIMYPTLYFQAVNQKKKKELLAEEMRVLYVALTRAKEKLVMVGTVNRFEAKQKKWESIVQHEDWILPTHYRASAKTYLDWVGPALIRHEKAISLRTENTPTPIENAISTDESDWKIEVLHATELIDEKEETQKQADSVLQNVKDWTPVALEDDEQEVFVNDRLGYIYPYQQQIRFRAKQSVTEIKRQNEVKDDYASDQLVKPFAAPIVKRPQFMQQELKISAAERGTAMHTVMQHLPLDKPMTAEAVEEFAEVLVEKEILERDLVPVIDFEAIAKFYDTNIAKYMMTQQQIYREVPFNLSLLAKDVYKDWQDEQDTHIFVQGIIDCVVPHEDGWIIIDYKTDRIDEDITDELYTKLKNRYRVQLDAYKTAIENIWDEKVTKAYLYFFDKQLLVETELN